MKAGSRREFIKANGMAALALSLPTIGISNVFSNSKPKTMFVHHVYFWMKPEATKEDQNKLYEGIKSLLSINTLKYSHLGIPADTDRPVIDKSYAFSLLTVFNDKNGHDIYQEHPIHKKFIADCQNLWTRVQVYDSVDRK